MKPLLVKKDSITTRETDSFKTYLSEISKIPQFNSPQEEYECAMKSWGTGKDGRANGCEKAREELVRRNLRFVVSVAKQYIVNGVKLEDVVNEGNIGISTAAERFNPTMGNKFISYAVWYIRKDIITYISNYSRMIKLPNNKINALSKFKKNMSFLEQKLERTVENHDMVDEYPDLYNIEDVMLLSELSDNNTTSLDMPLGTDDGSGTLHDILSNPSISRADELVNKNDNVVNVKRLLKVLKPQEEAILIMLYGLDGNKPLTLADIGEELGMSRERVRQKKEIAIRRIKRRYNINLKNIANY